MRRLLLPFLALLPVPAAAADRTVGIGSFDRIRVEGPFDVRITTGASPRATISGDRRTIERIELRVDGDSLLLRRGSGAWGDDDTPGSTPLVVTLSTGSLRAASLLGGSKVTIDRMKGERVELTVNGGGALSVGAADGGQLNAMLVGQGSIAIGGGRVTSARLIASGNGSIDAAKLDAGDVVARLDGQGTLAARARYNASGVNSGMGMLTIAGHPKCSTRGSTGPIRCGD